MDFLGLNQFRVLVWKNFILKRRQLLSTAVEVTLTILFVGVLVMTRRYLVVGRGGPLRYPALPVGELPPFFRAAPASGPWEVAFVPSGSVAVRDIVESVEKSLHFNFKVRGFASEGDFEDYIRRGNNSRAVLVAVVFDHELGHSQDALPLEVKYCLRFSSFQRNRYEGFQRLGGWETAALFPASPTMGPREETLPNAGSPGYITEGFLAVQHAVDRAVVASHGREAAAGLFRDLDVFVQRFPFPAYDHDYFFEFFDLFLPLVILFTFVMNFLTLVQSTVWEKEHRLKEYQLMIGLRSWMLWAAYFVTFLIMYSVTILLLCIIFFAKMEPVAIIRYSDPSLVFVFLLCFAISTISFSFMVSTFFNKVHFALSVGGFIYFATYFPAVSVIAYYPRMTLLQKLASCLSSNVGMALGTRFLVRAEVDKTGMKWSNIFSPALEDNFVFAYLLGMLVFDAALYSLVAWYIDAVFPGEYGVPKAWNFFLQRSHWSGVKPKGIKEGKQIYETSRSKYFEAEPLDVVAGIQTQHLCKEFQVGNTTKLAVKDFSLNLYEGQITVLLGHNGAGKSTILSILSGLYPATSGEAYVSGYAISSQVDQVRKTLGLCPQQDLLFNYLTVSEHLYFYCVIKGIPRKLYPVERDRMLTAFGLLEKRGALPAALSGGTRRRLSVIVALIGGSKVVILDEPTAGMDPASRRVTWDLLQQYKRNRTILLTTHCMDEADVLGDRTAVMVAGTLRCCGSSLFLKKIYGVGYHVAMVKEPRCNVEEICKLMYTHVPSAALEKNARNELSFILPRECTHSFEALFTELERRQKELGITSFAASVTTMEEVFIRVSNMEDAQTDNPSVRPRSRSALSGISVTKPSKNVSGNEREDPFPANESAAVVFNAGCPLYRQQFCAMLAKRALFSRRNWKLLLLQTLALLGSLALLLQAERASRRGHDEGARRMDLGQYGQTVVPLSISGNSNWTGIFLENLKRMLESQNHVLKEVQGDLLEYLAKDEDCVRSCIVAFSITANKNKITFTGLFNNQAYHSPSLSLAMLDRVLFMSVSGPGASLTVSNKPQPHVSSQIQRPTSNGFHVSIDIHFGMALFVSGFCVLTVTERVSKAKHIQFMSGVSLSAYWLSALLWDLTVFFTACCLLLGVFKLCQLDVYLSDYHFLDTTLIFMAYGWAAIPLTYLLSSLSSRSTTAYIWLVLFSYLTGIFSILIDATFQVGEEYKMSNSTKNVILTLLLLLPNYNLAKCIANYFNYHEMKAVCASKNPPHFCDQQNIAETVYALEEKTIGKYLVMMIILGLVYFLLVFIWETTLWKLSTFLNQNIYFGVYKTWKKKKLSEELSGECEDEDVANERRRVLGQPQESLKSSLVIKELTKIYFRCPAVLAVRNISVAIQKGECFGLLGFNGAGKSSTFQILTGEQVSTSGKVFIDGFSITDDIQKVKSRVGYCPQSDALLEYMTAREILSMYARLWGVSEPQLRRYVDGCLRSVHLESHADGIIGTYSGGNRRRLSTAIALMGKPTLILLDEPSTGMDPVARRLLWDAVTQARESGKAVVITSHRMEECDAFCSRLAIMAKGKLVCLGSPQHLKDKFGRVYILKIKARADTHKQGLDDLKNFITMTFPGSALKQENQGTMSYYIPSLGNSWAKVFGILEEAKKQFDLEDYSISQITLEQVFLTFAEVQSTGDQR